MKNIYRSVNTLSLFLYYKFISIKIYLCTKKGFYSLVLLSASESLSGYPQRTAPLRSLKVWKSLFKKILLVKYVTQDWLYSFRLWIARAEQSFKSPSRLGSYLLPTGEKRMVVVLKMRIKGRKKSWKSAYQDIFTLTSTQNWYVLLVVQYFHILLQYKLKCAIQIYWYAVF